MKNIVILRFNLPALILSLTEVESIVPINEGLLQVIFKNGTKLMSYGIKFN